MGLSSPFLDVPCLSRKKRRRFIQVFEYQGMEISHLMHGKYGNPFLSKLCRKNPIRSVFGLYKMSFIVYFEFWLSWFWFGGKFPMKRAKYGHFYVLLDTPSPRRRSARLSIELCLGRGP